MAERKDIRALPEPYRRLHDALAAHLPRERLVADPLRCLAFGTDASFYRLVPKLVVQVRSADEVVRLLSEAGALGLAVTFRAAGTSLSGQAISDSVLALVAGGFRRLAVLDGGARVVCEPGVIGADVNLALAPYGRKLGPDPASIGACMVGGIAANNSSGMCCGTAQNTYRTVESMKVVLPDGTAVDTGDAGSRERLARARPELVRGLAEIRDEIRADPALRARIAEKFRIKNTTGYALNAFVDFDDPVDILLHLLVGSEGTLAFIAEITYRTVEEQPHKASALAFFRDIGEAARATQLLAGGPVSAVELMDRASLRAVEGKPGMPPELRGLVEGAAALLIETRARSASDLEAQVAACQRRMAPVPALFPVRFTPLKAEYERLWDVRRGLFPAVGAARRVGTTVVIEDVAFPIARMAEGTLDLRRLLGEHGYGDAIIFGHALDGNLHFVFTPDFGDVEEVTRYARFMDDVCQMVARKYDGSLKAEHGTGRNIAPFVELEWGEKAYGLMKRVKALFDPRALLNPGVIINGDPGAHLKALKPLPRAHPIIDRCIECGFCEPRCPSRDVTTTPRQRIVVQREIARLRVTAEDPERLRRLETDYDYLGEATCATDGLCATACPVAIDTGEHTKWLRAQRHAEDGAIAESAAEHFAVVGSVARAALGVATAAHAVLGTQAMGAVARGMRAATGGRLPLWTAAVPRPARPRLTGTSTGSDLRAVYFPSCIARTMGPARGDAELAVHAAMLSVLAKARCDVVFPERLADLCCGMPFESKGYPRQAERKARELEAALLAASEGGELPIVFDTSPCAYRMKKLLAGALPIFDPVEFIDRALLPRLSIARTSGPVALHVTCSAIKAGLSDAYRRVAAACAEQVVVPTGVGCCGFAGDRGFTHPELNASALAALPRSLPPDCRSGYSSSRTCEIGLSLHAGIPYRSLAVLVDRCASALAAVRRPEARGRAVAAAATASVAPGGTVPAGAAPASVAPEAPAAPTPPGAPAKESPV
ncbi:FAD-binding and (Fe-S)-binding domain-containing protein [Anaeromyxobacter terrae]|uniref:FAD-binding and (Fe-S)-binding domain-containing protein n=1 Tax=Anaeromyxobacter terrae TaxID=2925406 RepID=UPI001F5911D3|nr:FAD-binding and (Fe-S)-binding domain-containing protein [Anaeromyxobacter sp. SG22]